MLRFHVYPWFVVFAFATTVSSLARPGQAEELAVTWPFPNLGAEVSITMDKVLVGTAHEAVDLSPDGSKLYVATWFATWDEGYSVYDANSYNFLGNECHTTSTVWWDLSISSDGQYVWVTDYYGGSLNKVNVSTCDIESRISLGSWVFGLARDKERRFLYVGENRPGTGAAGSLQKVDTMTESVSCSAALNGEAGPVTISPDGQFVLVTCWNTNRLYKIKTSDCSVVGTLDLACITSEVASVSVDGRHAYLADREANSIHVIDLETMKEVETLTVQSPDDLHASPWGDFGLVTSSTTNTISLISLRDGRVHQVIPDIVAFGASMDWREGQPYWDATRGKVYLPLAGAPGGIAVISVNPWPSDRCTVYQTDFSSDLGWATDQPDNYYWDAGEQAYHATTVNAGQWPSRYAYTRVDYRGGSFKLEFDLKAVSLGWSAGLSIGLFNKDLCIGQSPIECPGARGMCINLGAADGGKYFSLSVMGDGGERGQPLPYNSYEEGIWYYCAIEYDASADAASCMLTKRDTGDLIGTLQVSGFGGLPSNLDHLGFARDPAGSPACCPGWCGYDCSASATGYVDNINLSVRCPTPYIEPTLRLKEVQTSTCTPAEVRVFLTNPCPVEAFSFGVAHDPNVLKAVSCEPSGATSLLNEGVGPEFWHSSMNPLAEECKDIKAGITVGMVGSLHNPAGSTISPGIEQEIAKITYLPVSGVATGAVSSLDFVDCLKPHEDTEVTKCVVTCNSSSQKPEKVSGKIEITEACFKRGDCNCDGGFDISDPITVLNYLFNTAILPKLPCCLDSCDANNDEALDISDGVCMLGRLFIGAPELPEPFRACGIDQLDGDLGCPSYPPCEMAK